MKDGSWQIVILQLFLMLCGKSYDYIQNKLQKVWKLLRDKKIQYLILKSVIINILLTG